MMYACGCSLVTMAQVDKAILKGISGIIEPARLTACMGVSGSGKVCHMSAHALNIMLALQNIALTLWNM